MRLRKVLDVLGGAAAWPLAARTQQATMPVIGFLDSRSPEALTDRLRGFRQGLKDAGYVEGENVIIDSDGPRISSIVCRCCRLSWCADRSR